MNQLVPIQPQLPEQEMTAMEAVPLRKSRLRTLRDYAALLVRRRWWVVLPFLALSGVVILAVSVIPKMYVSQTMILIQPREVPTDFVKDLIAGNTEQRLSAIEQTILSRTNLLKILNEFEARLPGYRGLNDDLKVVKLKKRIQIDFPSERRRGQWTPVTNCLISYRDPDPELAQKINARLASLFIEQDTRARESQVFGTTEFLAGELKKVEGQMKESGDRLKALKEQYRYELPAELETNLRTLDRLQMQKTANVEALDRHVTMQMNLERQIMETPATLTAAAAARALQQGVPPPHNPLIDEYRRKELAYKDLTARATPKHPDVVRAKAELEHLRDSIPPQDWAAVEQPAPAAPEQAPAAAPNPIYTNLANQLRQVKTEIDIREREKKQIDEEMARYNQRVQSTPHVEQEIAAVLRTNEDLNKQYDSLKNNLEQARLAGSLESRQKGSQFVIIDPANYPLEPAAPKLPALLLGGLAASLAAGLALALVVDGFTQKVWTHLELERYLQAPVLVEIPSMVTQADLARVRRKQLLHAALFLLFAGVYLGGLYFLYLKQSALVRVLDPLIERITSSYAQPT